MKSVWFKKLGRLWVGIMALTVTMIYVVVSPSLAQPLDMIKVLVRFNIQPGPTEKALVHAKGGTVKYTYNLVPAIAMTLPAQAREALLRNPRVVAIDDDLAVHAIDAELDNTWGVKHIGAGTVHDEGNTGYGVRVGILDTGIDTDHPDLTYDPACSYSFVDGETLEDGHGHGTHTAGTVAALDNESGVVGVSPNVNLCIYKVLNNGGGGNYSDIIAALEQAVNDGVQITNNSYGSEGDPGSIVKAAFDNAYAAGVLNIGSAGNNGNADGTGDNCGFPARWDSVVATAATTQSDVRASFSSTCPEVELAAPGYSIYSTVPGGYGYKSGTSMASPHVAGTAALVLAANPTWTNEDIRLQLQDTAFDLGDLGRDTWYGYGLVDAVEATGSTPPSNNPPVADDQNVETDQDTPVDITLTGSDPDSDPLTFSVLTNPANGSLSGTAPDLTYTPDPDFSGSDSFTFKVNDGLVDSADATVSITVAPSSNSPPTANNQNVETDQDTPVDITLTGSDPDGDPLTFTVLTNPANGSLSGTAPDLTYTPDPDFSGSDSFTFNVNDGELDSATATVSITVTSASPADTVTITKAFYRSYTKKLYVDAVSSADGAVTLTATAFDSGGNPLGSAVLSYRRWLGHRGSIDGLPSKPYRVEVISSGGGSDSVEGGEIGGR